MIELARKYGDPILISDDSHYAHPEEKVVQDVRLAQSGSWRFYGSYHRQSSAEAFEYFRHKLGIDEKDLPGLGGEQPRLAPTASRTSSWRRSRTCRRSSTRSSTPSVGAKDSLGYTIHLVKQHGRMNWKDPVWVARLTQEINLLHRNGVIDLLPYFFIDEEVCRLYRDNKHADGPGPWLGRRPPADYLLGITHVDPIRSTGSASTASSRRPHQVRQAARHRPGLAHARPAGRRDGKGGWLQERFGECVAQISTIMTLKLRSAVLDVARFTLGEVPTRHRRADAQVRDAAPGPRRRQARARLRGQRQLGRGLHHLRPRAPGVRRQVPGAVGDRAEVPGPRPRHQPPRLRLRHRQPAHLGVHPADQDQRHHLHPVHGAGRRGCGRAEDGLPRHQQPQRHRRPSSWSSSASHGTGWRSPPEERPDLDGKYVPKASAAPDAALHHGHLRIDIWDLPEDQEVFADVATGKTETVFQFNTPGAVQWLRHFGYQKDSGNYAIDSIEGMAAFTALDRPGPLDAIGQDTRHRRRDQDLQHARRVRAPRARRQAVTGHLPRLRPLFPETHGVMVYQEQLQRLYQEVTGCTGAEAEEFRGNVAKKKKEKIIAAYPKFIEGATATLGSKERR
jgi:hypothetical protein